jgi:hypothetical protein
MPTKKKTVKKTPGAHAPKTSTRFKTPIVRPGDVRVPIVRRIDVLTSFVVFRTADGEIIVCTPETEKETVRQYFGDDNRNLEDADREVVTNCALVIDSSVTLRS